MSIRTDEKSSELFGVAVLPCRRLAVMAADIPYIASYMVAHNSNED
jgi:hypothetical protein